MSTYKCVVGDTVSYKYDQYEGTGIVKFVGSLLPTRKGLWIGVERDVSKSQEAKEKDSASLPEGHNGKLGDMQYFNCKKGRGLFVPYDNAEVVEPDLDDPKVKQMELQELMVRANTPNEQKEYNEDIDTAQQKLKKAEQLLEASLLLLQNGILYGHSVDAQQLQQHCEESWRFLDKKYPPSLSPMIRNKQSNRNRNGPLPGDDEEKFISFDDVDSEQRRQIKMIDRSANDEHLSLEQKKQILTAFMAKYSNVENWSKAGTKSYGVESYVFALDGERSIEVRMSFLYSMLMYLIQITGTDKRCIAHGTILFMIKTQQIDTLCKEFAMILETLQYHNDDGLWHYVYGYVSGIFASFNRQIKPYSGKRTAIHTDKKPNSSDQKEENAVAKPVVVAKK
mmetsp:Transcript_6780/g.11142  ORF Transcript_6780/g.11142 Transcript_6780/m.11142 type:complete len:394 (-) Transcript_6780:130-1311(-)|eukprot:CAMPEP_0197020820 /NCGR_PEP_ID=MMETSP1384-20130603/1698_1 /TAXON_ID=29189 /ORGANISM="Ammonia sp." /LENGTH=393 /DNA_ID=CAMNT_0042448521 /DNA_START=43 /DNA_END=1224 /DNA_ORIENTATION=+